MPSRITKMQLQTLRDAALLTRKAELTAYWAQSIADTIVGSAQQGDSKYDIVLLNPTSSMSTLGRDIVVDVIAKLQTDIFDASDMIAITYDTPTNTLQIAWN